MPAAVSLSIEREPDFFALSRARGCPRTLVAEAEGRIVGCVSVARRPARVAGRASEVAYIADLKVAPAARGRGLGARLVAEAMGEEARTRPPVPLLAAVAAGNRPIEHLRERLGAAAGVYDSVDMKCLQLFAAPGSQSAGVAIGRAGPKDEAELAALLDGFYRERRFAPVFEGGGLARILARSPGLGLSDHWVARRAGRIVAAVALWDQAAFKRVRILRLTPTLRAALAGLAIAARFLRLPAPPQPGGLLRLAFLRHPAHAPGEQAALAALLRSATRQAQAAGHHFAVLTAAHADPVTRCARGIPRLVYRYRLLVGATGPLPAADRAATLAFDDAALA